MSGDRNGAVLLEVVVALTILSTVGALLIGNAWLWHRATERARQSEADLRVASAFMESATLWTRNELDQRLGERTQGPWRLRIDRSFQSLYVLALIDAQRHVLIRTAVFREDPNDE